MPSGGKESVKDNKQPTMTSEKTEMGGKLDFRLILKENAT